MSFFVGGKLKLKNSKTNLATLRIKQQMTQSTISNSRKREEKAILDELKETIGTYSVSTEKDQNIVDQMINENKREDSLNREIELNRPVKINLQKDVDHRTAAEKKFDEMRLKKIPDRIEKEIQGNKKEMQGKFKKILDNQVNHFDIPKVGSG
mmetsp:Transcript_33161/g.34469  ORF Transcript_33161/g.34469 Transcript_33161/m.34469 type:complete len:153 (-) Transcript_33161:53-511(-)